MVESVSRPPHHSSDWDVRLPALIAAAERAWPGVTLSRAMLIERLRETEPDPTAHFGDLYLALACAQGDAAAVAHFERAFMPEVEASLQRSRAPLFVLEEVCQRVRTRLLVGDDGQPRIAHYQGRAPLKAWVAVIARRELWRVQEGDEAAPSPEALLNEAGTSADDLDLHVLRDEHRGTFDAAIEAALARLEPTTRALLRMHYFDGVPLGTLARAQGVDKSTISRWLTKAREGVAEDVRAELARSLALSEDELQSIIRALLTQFGARISRVLKQEPSR
jgi:RNA polymerase sigma-70 factor (ECF subfamily)